jgi:hypothetical protein
MNFLPEQAKLAGDIASLTTISATLMQILPPLAALFTVVWTAIRIYETRTFQKVIMRKKKEDFRSRAGE